MSRLTWDNTGDRKYEVGVKKGVVYPQDNTGAYPTGEAWNGLTNVTESPSGAEANPFYADDMKYANIISAEDFACTIEAYTYPDSFGECDGSAEIATGVSAGQQTRKAFGFTYVTSIGSDTNDSLGYKIHLVYGAKAAPSEKAYAAISDSPEPIAFSWECSTTPVSVTGFKPTAHLVIDSTKVDSEELAELEELIYGKDPTTQGGNDGVTASLPLPDAVAAIFTATQG